MACAKCDYEPCICRQIVPVIRDTTSAPVQQTVTKEEFGVELYDAIACCSGVQQLLRMISSGVENGKDVSHLSARYKTEREKAKLLAQSEAISGQDAARLARQYPWLLV